MKGAHKLDRAKKMSVIRDEVWNLTDSPLYTERERSGTYPVLGEGSYDADIMFIGEAPGKNEAQSGRPFCGASGKVLDELLEHIGLRREDVYITNVVKDRPPENRDPLSNEIDIYAPFLDRQIEIIEPKVIAPLGRHATAYILKRYGKENSKVTISEVHGKIHSIELSYGGVYVIPFFHPAVAVYNANRKGDLKTDFESLRGFFKS